METTTVRVYKSTQAKLKKISTYENISISELLDKLADEHEKNFWTGFEEESLDFLDKDELKIRKIFEKTAGDGIVARKGSKKGRNLAG